MSESPIRGALLTLKAPAEPTQCKVGDWIDSLPEEDQADVAEMLGMDVSDLQLHAALSPIFRVSREMIRQHRKMTCRCFQ